MHVIFLMWTNKPFQVELPCNDPRAKLENGLKRMYISCEESQRLTYNPRSCKGISQATY